MAHKFNYLLELYDLYYGEAASSTSKERNSGVRSQSTPPQHLETKETSRTRAKSTTSSSGSSSEARSPAPALATPRMLHQRGLDTGARQRASSLGRAAESVRDRWSEQRVEDIFKPMWSWYHGEADTRSRVASPSPRPRAASSDPPPLLRRPSTSTRPASATSSVDLTEALDPDWYFKERNEGEGGGILKSPGQIKHVGFGKNKVEFVDILGSSRAGSRRV